MLPLYGNSRELKFIATERTVNEGTLMRFSRSQLIGAVALLLLILLVVLARHLLYSHT